MPPLLHENCGLDPLTMGSVGNRSCPGVITQREMKAGRNYSLEWKQLAQSTPNPNMAEITYLYDATSFEI